MPRCYLIACSISSSLDQSSNNVSLFQLVEQINVAPGATPPPGGQLPLELHAYFELNQLELGVEWEMRFVLRSSVGLETSSDVFKHRVVTPRFRTRTLGLPVPPVNGHYTIHVDFRAGGQQTWQRDPLSWPISFLETTPKPTVTH